MATLQTTSISGNFKLGTTANTSAGGSMWYDSSPTVRRVRFSAIGCIGAYSAGGNLITARRDLAAAGDKNSGLAFGSFGSSPQQQTEEYNGNSWASGGNLNCGRGALGGTGTQNAALAWAGGNRCTEEYNGSSWAYGGAFPSTISDMDGSGTQNAALSSGGAPNSLLTVEYNGNTWTTTTNMNLGRCQHAQGGTQNSSITFAGRSGPSRLLTSEIYNGNTWSTSGNLNTDRNNLSGGGSSSNSAIGSAGFNNIISPSTGATTCTEEWNGISWTNGGSLITARYSHSGNGDIGVNFAVGGFDGGGDVASTEEYTKSPQNGSFLLGCPNVFYYGPTSKTY